MSATTKKKKRYHHGSLRAALVDSAKSLIAERGRAEFTLRELAKRLGVTHAATYHHFKDKDDLLAAVAEQGYHALRDRLIEALAQSPDHSVIRMRAMGVAYVRFAMENHAHFRVMFGHKFADISSYPELKAAGEATRGLMNKTLEQGQREEIYKDGDLYELAAISWSALHGLALLMINGHFDELRGDEDIDTFVLRISRHLFVGTGSESARVGETAMKLGFELPES